jgi:hypothetical protein
VVFCTARLLAGGHIRAPAPFHTGCSAEVSSAALANVVVVRRRRAAHGEDQAEDHLLQRVQIVLGGESAWLMRQM